MFWGLGEKKQPEPEVKPKIDRRDLADITDAKDFFRNRFAERQRKLLKSKHENVYAYINCTIQSQVIAPALVIQLESHRAALIARMDSKDGDQKEDAESVLKILYEVYNKGKSLDRGNVRDVDGSAKHLEARVRELEGEIKSTFDISQRWYEYRRDIKYRIEKGKIVSSHRKEIESMAGQSYSFLRNPQDRERKIDKADFMKTIDRLLYGNYEKLMNADREDYERVWGAQVDIYGRNRPISSTQKVHLFPTVVAWARRSYINMSIELADMVIRIDKLNEDVEEHERIPKSELADLSKALGFSTVEEAKKHLEKKSKEAKELRASCKNLGTKKHLEWTSEDDEVN